MGLWSVQMELEELAELVVEEEQHWEVVSSLFLSLLEVGEEAQEELYREREVVEEQEVLYRDQEVAVELEEQL